MDDLKVENGDICFAPDESKELQIKETSIAASAQSESERTETLLRELLSAGPSQSEWTETMMRDLLSESLAQLVHKSISSAETVIKAAKEGREAVPQPPPKNKHRVKNSIPRLHAAVSYGDSEEIIRIMCDLTPSELRDVVDAAVENLTASGLNSVAVRVDDFDRIVLFDEEKNRGFAMAPSGAYQRVSRFYDGSYRYGIELVYDDDLRRSMAPVFQKIRVQIAG